LPLLRQFAIERKSNPSATHRSNPSQRLWRVRYALNMAEMRGRSGEPKRFQAWSRRHCTRRINGALTHAEESTRDEILARLVTGQGVKLRSHHHRIRRDSAD